MIGESQSVLGSIHGLSVLHLLSLIVLSCLYSTVHARLGGRWVLLSPQNQHYFELIGFVTGVYYMWPFKVENCYHILLKSEYLANRFHFAMHMLRSRSQITSRCYQSIMLLPHLDIFWQPTTWNLLILF